MQHLIIELEPHGVLAGPIQRTMTEAEESLVHTYIPVLTRGRDAVQSIMSLSGRLIEHGYPMAVQRVNCLLRPSSRLRVLSNLPTYPWHHETAYWHRLCVIYSYNTLGIHNKFILYIFYILHVCNIALGHGPSSVALSASRLTEALLALATNDLRGYHFVINSIKHNLTLASPSKEIIIRFRCRCCW